MIYFNFLREQKRNQKLTHLNLYWFLRRKLAIAYIYLVSTYFDTRQKYYSNVNIIGVKINFKGTLSFYTSVSKAITGRVILCLKYSIGMKVVSSWSPFQIARQAASIISLQVIDYFCQLIKWINWNTTLFLRAQSNCVFKAFSRLEILLHLTKTKRNALFFKAILVLIWVIVRPSRVISCTRSTLTKLIRYKNCRSKIFQLRYLTIYSRYHWNLKDVYMQNKTTMCHSSQA